MRITLPLVAAFLISDALAQTGYFQGVTPRPPDLFQLPASLTVTRSAPPEGVPEVAPAIYTHVSTHPTSKTYEWANLAVLYNHSDFGANVASYAQARKLGRGVTWAGVFEVQDPVGRGGFHGLQIDAFTTGPSRSPAAWKATASASTSWWGALSTRVGKPPSTTACSSRPRASRTTRRTPISA